MPLRYARIYSFFFNSNHVYHRLYVISSLLSLAHCREDSFLLVFIGGI